jgi:hypothetical protein
MMHDIIERFKYRFQLWQREQREDLWGVDAFLRRNSLPLVLAFFGLVFIHIGHTQLKEGHFKYTSQDGQAQIFSPTENPFGGSINGQEVSFGEFWRRGGGPAFFIAGILFPITGYGFLRARNWSRYLFIGTSVASVVLSLFGSLFNALVELLWAAAVTYYLFWWPAVRDYFRVPDTTST